MCVAHHPVQIPAHPLGKERAAVAAERLQKQPEPSTLPPALSTQECRGRNFVFTHLLSRDCKSKRLVVDLSAWQS